MLRAKVRAGIKRESVGAFLKTCAGGEQAAGTTIRIGDSFPRITAIPLAGRPFDVSSTWVVTPIIRVAPP
ncbi:MAG: hypothetical protein ACREJU_15610 [Nitrospiraceae bacterium]